MTPGSRGERPPPQDQLGVTMPVSASWWSSLIKEEDFANLALGGKLVLLMDILYQCEQIGDKILVFSQSLVTLDLIEEFLRSTQGGENSVIMCSKHEFEIGKTFLH